MADIPVRRTENRPNEVRDWDPMTGFDELFDRMMGRGMSPLRAWPTPWSEMLSGTRAPKIDVQERDNDILVRAELPGVDKDDVDVSLDEDSLTVHAKVKHEDEAQEGTWYRREIGVGEFQRAIQLPGTVDTENAKARFHNGILEMTLPKREGQQRRRIPIEG